MKHSDKGGLARKLSHWYFSKRVLPYWCIILLDTLIVFVSCLFTYWVSRRFGVLLDHRTELLWTSLLYCGISWIGARIFRTYSGVVRYSSFVDLLKVAKANAVSMVIAIALSLIFKYAWVSSLSAFQILETVAVFVVATMLQWGMRVVVKLLFDVTNADAQSMPALVYGAITGGVGVAKNIRAQQPSRFELRGFITHEHRIKGMEMMGVPVYTLEDDIASVVRKQGIKAVIVSPGRVEEFRRNQKIQDILIGEGVKIFMSSEAKEANVKDGELDPNAPEQLQIREVSVEDLLPRQQIRVDMKSVGEQLKGKRVLITGSAGPIGSEIVRQVALAGAAKVFMVEPPA